MVLWKSAEGKTNLNLGKDLGSKVTSRDKKDKKHSKAQEMVLVMNEKTEKPKNKD